MCSIAVHQGRRPLWTGLTRAYAHALCLLSGAEVYLNAPCGCIPPFVLGCVVHGVSRVQQGVWSSVGARNLSRVSSAATGRNSLITSAMDGRASAVVKRRGAKPDDKLSCVESFGTALVKRNRSAHDTYITCIYRKRYLHSSCSYVDERSLLLKLSAGARSRQTRSALWLDRFSLNAYYKHVSSG